MLRDKFYKDQGYTFKPNINQKVGVATSQEF